MGMITIGYGALNGANDLKDWVDFFKDKNHENALQVAEQILGEFPALYETLSGKDFMAPVSSLINKMQNRNFAEYVELRNTLGQDIAERNLLGNDKKKIKYYDELYQYKQKLKELVENPNLLDDNINKLNDNVISITPSQESSPILTTPKIQIPANLQSNLNKNRPNFAINSYDPLVLDLNNDGKINLINSQTYFDYEGDGIKEAGYWLDKEDGFLDFTRKIA